MPSPPPRRRCNKSATRKRATPITNSRKTPASRTAAARFHLGEATAAYRGRDFKHARSAFSRALLVRRPRSLANSPSAWATPCSNSAGAASPRILSGRSQQAARPRRLRRAGQGTPRKTQARRGPRPKRARRLRPHGIAHHQLDRRRAALRFRLATTPAQNSRPQQPDHGDHLSETPPRLAGGGPATNRTIHAPTATGRGPTRNPAKAIPRTNNPGDDGKTRSQTTRRPRTSATSNPRMARTATRINPRTSPDKKRTRRSPKKARTIPTKPPKNAPAEFSRKTRISKKARSHPGGANSGPPRKTGNIMSGIQHFRRLAALLAAWLLIAASGRAEATSRLSTRFLARGEQALLEISVTGVQPTAFPEIPTVAGVDIRQAGRGAQTRLLPGQTTGVCLRISRFQL